MEIVSGSPPEMGNGPLKRKFLTRNCQLGLNFLATSHNYKAVEVTTLSLIALFCDADR